MCLVILTILYGEVLLLMDRKRIICCSLIVLLVEIVLFVFQLKTWISSEYTLIISIVFNVIVTLYVQLYEINKNPRIRMHKFIRIKTFIALVSVETSFIFAYVASVYSDYRVLLVNQSAYDIVDVIECCFVASLFAFIFRYFNNMFFIAVVIVVDGGVFRFLDRVSSPTIFSYSIKIWCLFLVLIYFIVFSFSIPQLRVLFSIKK